MATEFISYPATDSPVLTSHIGTITARTSKTVVPVSVIRNNEDPTEFFTSSFYSFNGMVSLHGLRDLIEEEFRAAGISYDSVSVYIDGESVTFTAIYCEYDMDTNFAPDSCFWTSSKYDIVHPNSAVTLSHWPGTSTTYHVKVVGRDPDGRLVIAERDLESRDPQGLFSFRVNDIIKFALNQTTWETGTDMTEVSHFAVSYGRMQKIFYVAKDAFFLTFFFKNIFNCGEYLDIVGKVKRKTVVDRSIAVCDGIARHYDRTVGRTYEVETGPLTEAQVASVEQLIGSHEVLLCPSDRNYKILITDHTCEADNDDESLTTMKFTFRFANDRPTPFGDELQALMPSASHIFSEQFTAEFT